MVYPEERFESVRVAFVTNHFKTEFFLALSKILERGGCEVFWISPSRHWAEWLRQRGVNRSNVLDVTDWGDMWKGKTGGAEHLKQSRLYFENPNTLRNIAMMDRLLKTTKSHRALRYLIVAGRHIEEFLMSNKVQMVFSERTWGLELVALQVCGVLDIPNYNPCLVRIPDGRFAFFSGANEAEIVRFRDPTADDFSWANQFLQEFIDQKPKPWYFYKNNRKPSFSVNWITKLLHHFLYYNRNDPHDETRPSISTLVEQRVREVVNRYTVDFLHRFVAPQLPAKRPFVLMTLHKQPEASIDVLGSYLSNQLETVRAVARSLPADYDLYIKEHSNAIGDRPLSFYKNLQKIPGAIVVHPDVNTFELISHSSLVMSVSGTVCFEAGLLGKKAVTMVPMFFSPLLIQEYYNPFEHGLNTMRRLLDASNLPSGDQRVQFLAWLFANSFKGVVADNKVRPDCTNDENLQAVAQGFYELFELHNKQLVG